MAKVDDPNPKPASPPAAPGADVEPQLGDTVVYRPNDREQYSAVVVPVLEYTNAQGICSWVRVPHKTKAQSIGYGPHWHEENFGQDYPADPRSPGTVPAAPLKPGTVPPVK